MPVHATAFSLGLMFGDRRVGVARFIDATLVVQDLTFVLVLFGRLG